MQSQQASGDSQNFSYDLRGRLASESDTYQPDQQHYYASNDTYAYDLANNLQAGTGGWSVNSNNQVTNAPSEPAAPALAGASGLSYDGAGHLTTGSGLTLGWDCWGRLASVSGSSYGPISYNYDALGRRVCKTVNGVSTYYLYDGNRLIAELDANGNVSRSYIWGPLGLISDHAGTASRFYLFDSLGNTRQLVNSAGTVLSSGAYTAYGSSLAASYPQTSFGYKGRAGVTYDQESGLFRMGARYYAASLGRFLSRDPFGFGAGPNLYAYCLDDPVDLMDPSGLWPSALDVGTFVDNLFGGFAAKYGDAAGRYDSGKASGWEVAKAGAGFAFELGNAACAVKGLGSLAVGLGREGLAALANAGEEAAANGGCFVAGTPVRVAARTAWRTQAGTRLASFKKAHYPKSNVTLKPVEAIAAEDYVASRNEKTGQVEWKRVERTTVRTVPVVVTVSLATVKTGKAVEAITATRDHPFYVRGKGFVPAGRLAVGNAIVTRAGPSLFVKKVEWHRRAQGYKVYNLVVEDNHTYFVGNTNGGVWVHNPLPCGLGRAAGELDRTGSTWVPNREKAGELFYDQYGGEGYRNTTGFDDLGTQQYFGSTAKTYHWDEALDEAGQLAGHGPDNPDGMFRHLQIHTPDGDILRIFYGPPLR